MYVYYSTGIIKTVNCYSDTVPIRVVVQTFTSESLNNLLKGIATVCVITVYILLIKMCIPNIWKYQESYFM